MAYTINAPSSEIGERGIVPFDSVVDDVQMLICERIEPWLASMKPERSVFGQSICQRAI